MSVLFNLKPQLPAYVDLIVLKGAAGEWDAYARNADGVHVPIAALDPYEGWRTWLQGRMRGVAA